MKRNAKTKLVNVWVTPEDYRALTRQAREEGRSMSDILRRSLRGYILGASNVKEQGAGNGRTDSCQMQ